MYCNRSGSSSMSLSSFVSPGILPSSFPFPMVPQGAAATAAFEDRTQPKHQQRQRKDASTRMDTEDTSTAVVGFPDIEGGNPGAPHIRTILKVEVFQFFLSCFVVPHGAFFFFLPQRYRRRDRKARGRGRDGSLKR